MGGHRSGTPRTARRILLGPGPGWALRRRWCQRMELTLGRAASESRIPRMLVEAILRGDPSLSPRWARAWAEEWAKSDQDLFSETMRARVYELDQVGLVVCRAGEWRYRASGALVTAETPLGGGAAMPTPLGP